MNYIIYNDIDDTVFKMMKSYLVNNDIDKIYKEWNFWDGKVERFKNNKQSRFAFEVLFIGNVLTAAARIQSYDMIGWALEGYSEGNTCALLSFVLQNVKWSVLRGTGKRIFEGPVLPEVEVEETPAKTEAEAEPEAEAVEEKPKKRGRKPKKTDEEE